MGWAEFAKPNGTLPSAVTGVANFAHDALGLASTRYADGRQMTLGQDAAGRITSRSVGGQTETLSYDQGAYGSSPYRRRRNQLGLDHRL